MIKDKNKEVYTSPQTEILVIRSEGELLVNSPFFGDTGTAGGDPGLNDDDYNYGGF